MADHSIISQPVSPEKTMHKITLLHNDGSQETYNSTPDYYLLDKMLANRQIKSFIVSQK